jgi:transcriptional regulator of acetoin/glycerol metabolism
VAAVEVLGVSVELPELPFHPDIDTDNRLVRAARPVLDRVQTMLADTAVSMVLADGHANVLHRWTGDPSLNHDLDAVWLAPGFSYAEPHVGTNAIGTALEEKRSAYVFGSEHFSSRLQSLSCAAAPIRHALTGRTEGVVDVTCRRSDASPLMLALVRQAAAEIEQRLVDEATAPERALLQQFLATNRRADQAVLTVGGDLVIANPAAFHLLGADDHALVRDRAVELMASPRETSTQMLLSNGQPATLHCSPVMSATGMAGAIVEVSVRGHAARSAKPSRPGPMRPLTGVAGRIRCGCRRASASKRNAGPAPGCSSRANPASASAPSSKRPIAAGSRRDPLSSSTRPTRATTLIGWSTSGATSSNLPRPSSCATWTG